MDTKQNVCFQSWKLMFHDPYLKHHSNFFYFPSAYDLEKIFLEKKDVHLGVSPLFFFSFEHEY